MGRNAVNYTFGYTLSATAYVLSSNLTGIPSLFPPTLDDSQLIGVTLSRKSLHLKANTSGTFEVDFSLPEAVDESLIPIYSGSVRVRSSRMEDGPFLQIPFMGIAANMTTQRIFDTSNGFPIFRSEKDNETITSDGALVSMDLTDLDLPALVFRLLLPTRVLMVNVLPPDQANSNATIFAGLRSLG
jgi:hypothetical protein